MSYDTDEARSLDLVQRWVISALVIVVVGAPTTALAIFSARSGLASMGLWIMSGVLGLIAALAVLLIHRRRRWMLALAIVGLLPAAISAYFLFL